MKILITGASGFLGSWFCRVLSEKHEVTALVRTESDLSRIEDIKKLNIEIQEEKNWAEFITKNNFEVFVFNDWWGVGNKFRNDDRQFENIYRFKKMISAANKPNTKLIIGVGSQAELGPVSGTISETQTDNPSTKYGIAKIEARKALLEGAADTSIRTVWLRIFSTYGPLDSSGWLITDTISNLLSNQIMELTLGEQDWSYLHSYDLAKALETVIETDTITGIVNAGNPNTNKISQVVNLIAEKLNKKNLIKLGALPYRKDQVMELKPVCEKLTAAGWRPMVSLSAGLSNLIDWFSKIDSPLMLENGTKINLHLPKIRN